MSQSIDSTPLHPDIWSPLHIEMGGASNEHLMEYIKEKDILHDPRIEAAFRIVDRAWFIPIYSDCNPADSREVYEHTHMDSPLKVGPIHLSAPSIYVLCVETMKPLPGMNVLNVGGGSNYLNSILSLLLGSRGCLHSIEIKPIVYEHGVRCWKRWKQFMRQHNIYSSDDGNNTLSTDQSSTDMDDNKIVVDPCRLSNELNENGQFLLPAEFRDQQDTTGELALAIEFAPPDAPNESPTHPPPTQPAPRHIIPATTISTLIMNHLINNPNNRPHLHHDEEIVQQQLFSLLGRSRPHDPPTSTSHSSPSTTSHTSNTHAHTIAAAHTTTTAATITATTPTNSTSISASSSTSSNTPLSSTSLDPTQLLKQFTSYTSPHMICVDVFNLDPSQSIKYDRIYVGAQIVSGDIPFFTQFLQPAGVIVAPVGEAVYAIYKLSKNSRYS